MAKKGLPLYRLLRKSERFSWTLEAEEALAKLKALLTNPPVLVPPTEGEALLLYVAAATQVVSAAVVVQRQEEGMLYLSNDPFTSLAKYSPKLRHATPISRS